MTTDFFFVKRNSNEWNRMWDGLKQKWGDTVDMDEETGECWQYMGTQKEGHCFRHRCHPKTKKKEYFFVKVSDRLNDTDLGINDDA